MTSLAQPTSNEIKREGLDDVRRSGRAVRQKLAILADLRANGPSTRHEIYERTGIPLASVCGRCNALLDASRLEVVGTVGKPARQVLDLSPAEVAQGMATPATRDPEGAQ
ncbi:hypothetical protein [Halomonas sp. CKK8]|uniref:hypothetical protein n=1 Tax=Halomonas sp. CKK8 TaxID=3036127 RepID=UPI00241530D5|nr:hypothetical protein [Halomonas sp. CKK8]WFM72934.1 hypothetical protein P8934_08050 [Halomonas sp. CKK8]